MENLKALVYKGDLTPYQRALAKREFEGMVERLELLEKAVKNNAVLPLISTSTGKSFEYWSKKEFEALPKRKWDEGIGEFDSIT